jgi:hypothetical protein
MAVLKKEKQIGKEQKSPQVIHDEEKQGKLTNRIE